MFAYLKYLLKSCIVLVAGTFIAIFCSCGNDEEFLSEEVTEEATDVAVTGPVECVGVAYVRLKSYANLNLLSTSSGEVGVEIVQSLNEDSLFRKTSSSLQDNIYSIEFNNLCPDTEYKYRAFTRNGRDVYYGEYQIFKTKPLLALTITGETNDITFTSAQITSTVIFDSIYSKDNLFVGVAYSTSPSFTQEGVGSMNFKTSDELSLSSLSESGYMVALENLYEGTLYYYAAFTKAGNEYRFGEVKSFNTKEIAVVDLGLGVKWAVCNIGANSPEEFGGYYAWGDIEKKDYYSWDTYRFCVGSRDFMTKYCSDEDDGVLDNKTVLDPEDDVAHFKLGGAWRMPTKTDIDELIEKCTWEWTTYNDVNGMLVTGTNGKSIFFPAAGYYFMSSTNSIGKTCRIWMAQKNELNSTSAYCLKMDSDDFKYVNASRIYGLSVRPVKDASFDDGKK